MLIADLDKRVHGAISQGARRSGADFRHLLVTSKIESGGNPDAKANTSSAAGLFQFTEQTWLQMVHRHGAKHGLGDEATAIARTADGRYAVADPAVRQQVLALRHDGVASAQMAGELTNDNRAQLAAGLGRSPTAAELYLAHFLGVGGALKIRAAADAAVDAQASSILPAAARANPALFAPAGRSVSAGELVRSIETLYDRTRTSLAGVASSPSDPPALAPHGNRASDRARPGVRPLAAPSGDARIFSIAALAQETLMKRYIEIATAAAGRRPPADGGRTTPTVGRTTLRD